MQITQHIKLNIYQRSDYTYLDAKQADDNSRFLNVQFTDGENDIFVTAGVTVTLRCQKPDGTAVYNNGTRESDGTVTVELTDQVLAVEGIVYADISTSRNGEILSSATFIIRVIPVPTGTQIVSTNEFLQLTELIEELEQLDVVQLQQDIDGLADSMAAEYSSSSTYIVGDYVLYDGYLYRCTTAIPTAEAWNSSHWTQIRLASDVESAIKAINLTLTTSNVPSTYPDLKSFRSGSIITVSKGAAALLSDSPYSDSAFYLLTGKTFARDTEMRFQMAFPYLSDASENLNRLAIRTYNLHNSTYTDWVYEANSNDVDSLTAAFNRTIKGYSTAVTGSSTYSSIADFEAGSIHYLTTAGVEAMPDSPRYTSTPLTVFTGIMFSTKKLFQIAYPHQAALAGWFAVRIQNYYDDTFYGWQYHESPMTSWITESTAHGYINSKLLYTEQTVKLGVGDFHITGSINIPAGKTLEGSGQGTRIICHAGARVNLTSGSTIRNIMFVGYGDEIELTTEPPTTDYTQGVGFVASTPQRAVIDNCWFYNFSSAGVILYETGTPVDHNVLISNCFFYHCNRGLWIKADAEYNRVTNCSFTRNAIGILTRGGNNNFVNCGLDANIIGIQFDEDEGSNNGHSLMADCTINHSDNNTGYGLIIKDTGRILVNNCNIYYSKVKIASSNGNIIANCGLATTVIEVTGAGCNIIHDNMFRNDGSKITLPSNHKCKLHDNYYRDGTDVTVEIV